MMTRKRKKQITMSGLTHLAKDWIMREYKVHPTAKKTQTSNFTRQSSYSISLEYRFWGVYKLAREM